MTSYSVSCGVHATDNDHLKLAELRLAEAYAPEFITGLRALLNGKIELMQMHDTNQMAVITGNGATTFTMLFENGSSAYLCENDLYDMEEFVLDRIFGYKKPKTSLTLQLNGEDDLQLSVSLWVGTRRG